jgi:inorganic pyrophosphatase
MSTHAVTAGPKVPYEINVIVEIPKDSDPVKYEVDKASGAIFVDRVLSTPMRYPCNYGYMPRTLCDDGDPIDVVIVMPLPLVPGAVIQCRPVGLMDMEDEHGEDTKIIAVPLPKVFPAYEHIHSIDAVPESTRARIQHFFEHYKDLESGKWVRLKGWRDAKAAREEIIHAIDAYRPAATSPEAPSERP